MTRIYIDTDEQRSLARLLRSTAGDLSGIRLDVMRSISWCPPPPADLISADARIGWAGARIAGLATRLAQNSEWLDREAASTDAAEGGGILARLVGLLSGGGVAVIALGRWPHFLPWGHESTVGAAATAVQDLPRTSENAGLIQGGNKNIANTSIVDAAMNAPDRGDNCAVTVRKWFEAAGVKGAGGSTPDQAWKAGGGKIVPARQMRPGDVIQVGDPNGSWDQEPVPHTMLVTKVHLAADGSVTSFDVRESNYAKYNTVGHRENLTVSMFDTAPPRQLLVYRFGSV